MNTTAVSTQEWLDAVERAKEFANMQTQLRRQQTDDTLASGVFSHAATFDEEAELESSPPPQGHRGILQKQHSSTGDNDSMKGRKRFSKRQSKSGLTAVF